MLTGSNSFTLLSGMVNSRDKTWAKMRLAAGGGGVAVLEQRWIDKEKTSIASKR